MFGNGHERGYTTVVVSLLTLLHLYFQTQPFVLGCYASDSMVCCYVHASPLQDPIQEGPHQDREFLQEGLDWWRIARDCYLLYKRWPMTWFVFHHFCKSSLNSLLESATSEEDHDSENTRGIPNGPTWKLGTPFHPHSSGESPMDRAAGRDALPRRVPAQWAHGEGHPSTWSRWAPEASHGHGWKNEGFDQQKYGETIHSMA